MSTHTWRKLLFSLIMTATFMTVSAQESKKNKEGIKRLNVGVSFNMQDFDTETIFPWKDSTYGFSVMLWKGITPKIDYSIRYNGIFPNQNKNNVISKNFSSSELEAAIHAKAFKDNAFFNPFLTLGIGGGKYHKNLSPVVSSANTFTWNTHALGGVGLQLNIKNELYFLLQANYRYSFNEEKLPHNLFYSFGLTKSLYKTKKVEIPVVADKDNDGVPDNIDICPDIPGIASLQGCPDRDSDGIADKDDKCPDVKGLASLNGCPDSDGDGFADNEDKCPTQFGIAKYQGCPIPDTDKDGINDEQDKCPTVAGVPRYDGCPVPDSDKDGINDEEDKCPNLAGVAENQGCPIVTEEVKKKVNLASKNILFVTGSAKLQKSSFKGLNEVVNILLENPDMQLQIDGHTDNVGSEEMNQTLSDNRTKTVKDYILSKGIDENRIKAEGHGELQPIADNKNAAGRQLNRRVELLMKYFN
ncbi:MAG: OmpA family protein [Chitinophagaceae bacterium]